MRMNPKQQLLVAIAIFTLALLGEGTFAYFTWSNRTDALAKIQSLHQQEVAANGKKAQIPALKRNALELQNIIEEYAEILPTDAMAGTDAFVDVIGSFAEAAKLEFKEASPLPVAERKAARRGKTAPVAAADTRNFVQYRYQFKFRGTSRGLLAFLESIENHSRFLQVDAITVLGKGAKNGDGTDFESEALLCEDPVKDIEVEISTYTYSNHNAN